MAFEPAIAPSVPAASAPLAALSVASPAPFAPLSVAPPAPPRAVSAAALAAALGPVPAPAAAAPDPAAPDPAVLPSGRRRGPAIRVDVRPDARLDGGLALRDRPGKARRRSAPTPAPLPAARPAPPPEVSVVIPAYDAERFVARAIRSALAQTGVRVAQVIAIDDASTDGTLALLRRLARDEPRLLVLAQPRNLGPGAARNRGIDAATAPWVAVLDADDAMEPGRLARLIGVAERRGFDAVGDLWTNWDPRTGRPAALQIPASGRTEALGLADMIRLDAETGEHLAAIKPVFRRRLRDEGRLGYPEGLRLGEDLSMYRGMMVQGVRFGLVRERLYRFTPRMIDGRLVGTSVTRVDYAALARDTRRFADDLRRTPLWSDGMAEMLKTAVRETARKDRRWGWTMLRAGEWRQLCRWLARDPRKALWLLRIAAAKALGHRGPPD